MHSSKISKDWPKKADSKISVPTISVDPTSRSHHAGADLPAIQRLVDHAFVNTTARYNRRGEAAAKKAAAMIDL
jgi:integrase